MTMSLFKSNGKIYSSNMSFTGTLKKTKKECREAYKKEWSYNVAPAKMTPKVISETYDEIKKFIEEYMKEGFVMKIWSTSDTAEHTLQSRCYIKIYDKETNDSRDSRDYMPYNTRRRVSLSFFDNVELEDDSTKEYYVDAVECDNYIDSEKDFGAEENIPF